jgi:RNA polymerase subunit RPABC4/transcription elongation factor Spt4
MAPPTAVFGIHSGTLSTIVDLVILVLAVVWLALIYWTYADARRRIADPILVGCATAAALFPFIGTFVYTIVRPPEFLEDVRERELEIQAAQARLAEIGMHSCPHCDGLIEKDFLRCPHCLRKLKSPCAVCARPLDPRWRICPFCEADVATSLATGVPAAGAPAARRVRRQTVAAAPGSASRAAASASRAGALSGPPPDGPLLADDPLPRPRPSAPRATPRRLAPREEPPAPAETSRRTPPRASPESSRRTPPRA